MLKRINRFILYYWEIHPTELSAIASKQMNFKRITSAVLVVPVLATFILPNLTFAGEQDQKGYLAHPCTSVIQIERQQIEIMSRIMEKIDADAELMASLHQTSGVIDATDAISSAVKGDLANAAKSALSAAIQAGWAVVKTKNGNKETAQNINTIDGRKARLQQLVQSPEMCTVDTKKTIYTQYILESTSLNKIYIGYLNEVVRKADIRDTTKISGTVTLIMGIAMYASFNYMTKNGGNFFPLAGATIGGLVSGSILLQDLFIDGPRLNSLRALKTSLEKVNSDLEVQLVELQK